MNMTKSQIYIITQGEEGATQTIILMTVNCNNKKKKPLSRKRIHSFFKKRICFNYLKIFTKAISLIMKLKENKIVNQR